MQKTDKRRVTSKRNGKLGGRPTQPDANVMARSVADEAARLTLRPPVAAAGLQALQSPKRGK
jgi:hypothetical protein